MEAINSSEETGEAFGVKFVDPDEVIKNLELTAGMKVADFGCGGGHFSVALARKVGDSGLVYAFDILPDKLEAAASNAKGQNLTNVITKRANLEKVNGSKLEAGSLDAVVLKDMLFENRNKSEILTEAKRVLKDGGKVLIIEWSEKDGAIGPARELRFSKEALLGLAQQVGLTAAKVIKAGSFHFGVVLVK